MKNVIAAILLVLSIATNAAECKFIPKKSAQKIKSILNQHHAFEEIAVIDSFCKECEDTYVRPIVIDKIEMKKHSIKGFYSLNINNEPLELAHIYLNGENLAYKIGCDSKFATKYLYQVPKRTRKTSSAE
jgi:hypothetical protein